MNNSFIAKFITILITTLIILSLTACAFTDAVTAYSLYAKAAKTINKAGGYETDCIMTMSFDILGSDMSQSFNINTKQNGKNSQVTSSLTGTEIITTRIDDTVYVETNNSGIKYNINPSNSGDSGISTDKSFPKLSKDLFEGIEVNKNEGGKRSITVTADSETVSEFLAGYFGNDESLSASIGNMTFTFTFDKKGNLEAMNINCDMVITVMGMSLNGKIIADYTFVNFGAAPEITLNLPEESYEDGGEYNGNDIGNIL